MRRRPPPAPYWRVRMDWLTAYGFDAAGIARGGAWPDPIVCVCSTCIEYAPGAEHAKGALFAEAAR